MTDPRVADLRLMIRVAQEAGAGLLDRYASLGDVPRTEKTAGDFVSDADLRAERLIRTRLQAAHPGIGWLGEETGASGEASGPRWIVDPLDGTTNFLHGLPHWAVSIALAEGDRVIAGVVHDPVKAETFAAGAGRGAHLNGAPIRVSRGVPLSHALLATGVPAGGRVRYLPHSMRDIEGLMPDCAGIRRWGAATLDLAYVASGRIDAYWERNLGPWDVAAGLLLVTEAGGDVRPLWPGRPALETGSVLAANADLGPVLAPRLCDARDRA